MSLRVVHLIVQNNGEEHSQRVEEECVNWDSSIPIARYIRPDGSVEEFHADGTPLHANTPKEIGPTGGEHVVQEIVTTNEEIPVPKNQNSAESSSNKALAIAASKADCAPAQQIGTLQQTPESEQEKHARALPSGLSGRVANVGSMSAGEIEELIEEMDDIEDLRALREEARTQAKRLARLRVADSAPRCAHVRTNGTSCGSPALKEDQFCYFHSEARKMRDAAEAAAKPAEMPILEDARGLQLAIMRVCTLLADNKIEEKTARAIFDGLRLAQKTMNE